MPRILKTHCKRGHEFTPKNTMPNKLKTGYIVRKCRRCESIMQRRRYRERILCHSRG